MAGLKSQMAARRRKAYGGNKQSVYKAGGRNALAALKYAGYDLVPGGTSKTRRFIRDSARKQGADAFAHATPGQRSSALRGQDPLSVRVQRMGLSGGSLRNQLKAIGVTKGRKGNLVRGGSSEQRSAVRATVTEALRRAPNDPVIRRALERLGYSSIDTHSGDPSRPARRRDEFIGNTGRRRRGSSTRTTRH